MVKQKVKRNKNLNFSSKLRILKNRFQRNCHVKLFVRDRNIPNLFSPVAWFSSSVMLMFVMFRKLPEWDLKSPVTSIRLHMHLESEIIFFFTLILHIFNWNWITNYCVPFSKNWNILRTDLLFIEYEYFYLPNL